jgi:two-component system sensor histidine kinase/response regulator
VDKPTILIVDDEQLFITILGGLLHQNYRVLVATSGEQAIRRARGDERPDLILLDVMMPGMDGYTVCHQLKQESQTRDIPVIFLTANNDEQEEARGFEVGAVDYISKPVRPAVVLARVRTHLELKRIHAELQQKNAALEEASRLRDDVDRILRHDLKSPLTSIITLPSLLLLKHDLTDDEKELLMSIERSGHKMLDMINRSLDLYKMEVGSYNANLEPVDLLPILRGCMKEIARIHAIRKISCELFHCGSSAADDLQLWVQGEVMLCYPLFSNLLQNAFEASPDGGRVEVVLADRDDRFVTISISNSGAAPAAIRERFFDKYVTSGKQNGTGLGTYSARLCAETQHGAIRLEPSSDDKTCVVVELQRH